MESRNDDTTIGDAPVAVYLCQVSEGVSCGACCGLYNVPDLSRERLESMLADRTRRFREVPRTVEGIEAFGDAVDNLPIHDRPYPHFHHCPFLGLIDDNRRVGCLLHPDADGNDGTDWRGLSYYGGFACRTYFCPTTHHLPDAFKQIVRQAAEHWYDYGLIVTERRLLTLFFDELETRLGRPVIPEDFRAGSRSASLLNEFARLKHRWMYRRPDAAGPCNYFFENGEYPRPPVMWPDDQTPPSSFADMFRELESGFSNTDDLIQAELLLDGLMDKMVRTLRAQETTG